MYRYFNARVCEHESVIVRAHSLLSVQAMIAAGEDAPEEAETSFYRADDDEHFFKRKANDNEADSSEEEAVVFRCEACSKSFKVRGLFMSPCARFTRDVYSIYLLMFSFLMVVIARHSSTGML